MSQKKTASTQPLKVEIHGVVTIEGAADDVNAMLDKLVKLKLVSEFFGVGREKPSPLPAPSTASDSPSR